jgi:ribose transport system permease protein
MFVYIMCALLAGFAGIVESSRSSIAQTTACEGYELEAIAACVIGGTSLMGGEGTVIGAVAGALIMQVLVNFCNLVNISPYWQKILVGALVVALVLYDTYRKRRAGLLRE